MLQTLGEGKILYLKNQIVKMLSSELTVKH